MSAVSRPSLSSRWPETPSSRPSDASVSGREPGLAAPARVQRGPLGGDGEVPGVERNENGKLLRAAAAEFDVFVTLDSNLEHQQNVAALDLAIVVIRAASSDLADLEPALLKMNALPPAVRPGRSYVITA